MPDYTPVVLDTPITVPKPAMTLAGIRRHHRFDGFDVAEFLRQIVQTTVHAVAPDQPRLVYERGDEEDSPLDVWMPVVTRPT